MVEGHIVSASWIKLFLWNHNFFQSSNSLDIPYVNNADSF